MAQVASGQDGPDLGGLCLCAQGYGCAYPASVPDVTDAETDNNSNTSTDIVGQDVDANVSGDRAFADAAADAVTATAAAGCLSVQPHDVSFGATAVGQSSVRGLDLCSCSPQPVCISAVTLNEVPAKGPFGLDWSQAQVEPPSPEKPLCISGDTCVQLQATYLPQGLFALDPTGKPIADTASVTVQSDAGGQTVTLQGLGADCAGPMPVITVAEGDAVMPGTILHLSAADSVLCAPGSISKFDWKIIKSPVANSPFFLPCACTESVTLKPVAAGLYEFELVITDDMGHASAIAATHTVNVIAPTALRVELMWNTPGDSDQTNEGPNSGSDFDIHLANELAKMPDYDQDGLPDPWFSDAFDCYFATCLASGGLTLEWGSYDPNVDDNPHLDRDDTDGAGPEGIDLSAPEPGTYSIGVFDHADNGFGPSIATVEVWAYGQAIYWAKSDVPMQTSDLWAVAKVNISNKVSAVSWQPPGCEAGNKCAQFITANYPAPAK